MTYITLSNLIQPILTDLTKPKQPGNLTKPYLLITYPALIQPNQTKYILS
jgi:hypothetical protein